MPSPDSSALVPFYLDPLFPAVAAGLTLAALGALSPLAIWLDGKKERYLLYWCAGWTFSALRWLTHIAGEQNVQWRLAEVILVSIYLSLLFLGSLDLLQSRRPVLKRAPAVLAVGFAAAITLGFATDRLIPAMYLASSVLWLSTAAVFAAGYRKFRLSGFALSAAVYLLGAGVNAFGALVVGSAWRNSVVPPLYGFFIVFSFGLIALQRARQSERESEVKFVEMFQRSLDPMWIVRVHGNGRLEYEDWNEAQTAAVGVAREKALGRTAHETWPKWAADPIEARWRACIASGEPFTFQETWPLPGGKRTWLISNVPLKDQSGKVVRLAGIARDITETIRASEEIRKLSIESQTLLDVSLVGIAFMIDRKIVRCNLEFARMFGYERDEMTGMSMERLYPSKQASDERAAVGYPILAEFGFNASEYPMKRKDGSIFHCQAMTRTVDQNDLSKGYVWAGTDATARHAAEEELRKFTADLENRVKERTAELETANRELADANKELETFSYSVSHDLSGPARRIAGFSALLLKDFSDSLSDTAKNYLRRISLSAHRMGELTNALLTLSRVAHMEIRETNVDLSDLARSVAAELKLTAADRQAEFKIADNLSARGDARLLQIALENLLGNAWKYTAKCEHAKIEFGRSEGPSGEREFFVRDNGAGFDMAHAAKLFEPFERLHSTSEFEGTGVGLATVHRIVSRHHGKIWAEAEPGEGASFYFTIG
jgi:PAS domain S-box-containing protein